MKLSQTYQHRKEYFKKWREKNKEKIYLERHSNRCICGKIIDNRATKCQRCSKLGLIKNFKGKTKNGRGYIFIYNKDDRYKGNHISEHRLVMEKHLGRHLKSEEVVHHIDRDITNNNIENLHLFNNNNEHAKYHQDMIKIILEFI
jgi:hypothetical protein